MSLKNQLHTQLQLARAAQISARRTGRGDLSELRRREYLPRRRSRLREIRVVEQIERLGPELQRHALADGRGLGDRQVDILESRRLQCVATHVAETLAVAHERRRIEPLLRRLMRRIQRLPRNEARAIEA